MDSTLNDKKFAVVGPADYLEPLFGQILYCVKKDGKKFAAKLVGLKGTDLIFQTRDGAIILNDLYSLAFVQPVDGKKRVV